MLDLNLSQIWTCKNTLRVGEEASRDISLVFGPAFDLCQPLSTEKKESLRGVGVGVGVSIPHQFSCQVLGRKGDHPGQQERRQGRAAHGCHRVGRGLAESRGNVYDLAKEHCRLSTTASAWLAPGSEKGLRLFKGNGVYHFPPMSPLGPRPLPALRNSLILQTGMTSFLTKWGHVLTKEKPRKNGTSEVISGTLNLTLSKSSARSSASSPTLVFPNRGF